MWARRRPETARAALALVVLLLVVLSASACSGCGKGSGTGAAGSSTAAYVNRTTVSPEAGPVAVRDVAMWSSARQGATEDLASLAVHEGAAGLVEAAAEDDLRVTALRAMGYARGWAHLPYLAGVAGGKNEDEARLALESVGELASRPRRAEDVEDVDELREGCEALAALARDDARDRRVRVPALRALRMMPCPKLDLPTDLDAK